MNIQDIVPDREIKDLDKVSFAGLDYESWEVQPPIWADQVEKLLENGFMVMIDDERRVIINRQIKASPDAIRQNKNFHRRLWASVTDGVDGK